MFYWILMKNGNMRPIIWFNKSNTCIIIILIRNWKTNKCRISLIRLWNKRCRMRKLKISKIDQFDLKNKRISYKNQVIVFSYLNNCFGFIRTWCSNKKDQLRSTKYRIEKCVNCIDRITLLNKNSFRIKTKQENNAFYLRIIRN